MKDYYSNSSSCRVNIVMLCSLSQAHRGYNGHRSMHTHGEFMLQLKNPGQKAHGFLSKIADVAANSSCMIGHSMVTLTCLGASEISHHQTDLPGSQVLLVRLQDYLSHGGLSFSTRTCYQPYQHFASKFPKDIYPFSLILADVNQCLSSFLMLAS